MRSGFGTDQRRRKWPHVALVCLVCAAGLWLAADYHDAFNDRRFDRAVWMSAKADDPDSPRGPMARDVLRHHLRQGMLREDVLRLLGPPDDDPTFPYLFGNDSMSYLIGMGGGFRMDYYTLTVQFDPSGKLISADIWQH